MQNCQVCHKLTNQCCARCSKAFYCSKLHQEVHWHQVHKNQCTGLRTPVIQFQPPSSPDKSSLTVASHFLEQNEIKEFVQLVRERLTMRKSCIQALLSAQVSETPLSERCRRLYKLSTRITMNFKSWMTEPLSNVYNLLSNVTVNQLEQAADAALMVKALQRTQQHQEAKTIILKLGSTLEELWPEITQESLECTKGLLSVIAGVSEVAGLNRVTEDIYVIFIKLLEKFEGAWEQLYGYYNIGVWYGNKTYCKKAVRIFSFLLERIQTMRTTSKDQNVLSIFQGDCLFNLAVCSKCIKDSRAASLMKETLQIRSKFLGKNSIEVSQCWEQLARWAVAQKKYEEGMEALSECHRIRKEHPQHVQQLDRIVKFLAETHKEIMNVKKKQEEEQERISRNKVKKLEKLAQTEQVLLSVVPDYKETAVKKLFQEPSAGQVGFKFYMNQEFAQGLSSVQFNLTTPLLALIDKPMTKQLAIQTLLDSEFFNSLSQDQRQHLLLLNRYD